MTAAKRPQPTQAEHAERGAELVRTTTCRHCRAPILTARSPGPAAIDVRADPEPLDLVQEVLARLQGRFTWHLVTTGFGRQRITDRWPDIHAANNRWPVIADHACPPQPVQETLL